MGFSAEQQRALEIFLQAKGESDPPERRNAEPSGKNPNPAHGMRKMKVNVGGQRFAIYFTFLQYLSVECGSLHQYAVEDREIVYFLDRDPDYFRRLLSDFAKYGEEGVRAASAEYSDGMITELYHYGLSGSSLHPTVGEELHFPLTVGVGKGSGKTARIHCGDAMFLVSDRTLSLTNLVGEEHHLDYRPRDLRVVVNLLRLGRTTVLNSRVLGILGDLGVDYQLGGQSGPEVESLQLGDSAWQRTVSPIQLNGKYSSRRYWHPSNFARALETVVYNTLPLENGTITLTGGPHLLTSLEICPLPTEGEIELRLGDLHLHYSPDLCRLHSTLYGGKSSIPLSLSRGCHIPLRKLLTGGKDVSLHLHDVGEGTYSLRVGGVLLRESDGANQRLLTKRALYNLPLYWKGEVKMTGSATTIPLPEENIRDLHWQIWSSEDWVSGGDPVGGGIVISAAIVHRESGETLSYYDSLLLPHPGDPSVDYISFCGDSSSELETGSLPAGEWDLVVRTVEMHGYIRVHARYNQRVIW